ncbi:MAG: hypothetical protein M3Q82_06495, partial [Actinomycetota bacterium]|nr:hypothetical protein [Actinomycetota bacterium]
MLIFRLLPNGSTNRDLRDLVGQLLDHTMSAGQLTYDPRRLRAHGLLTRLPHSHRYQVTDTGLHRALFLTRAHDRLLRTGLAQLSDPAPGPLQTASRTYQHAIDTLAEKSGLAAGNLTRNSGSAGPSLLGDRPPCRAVPPTTLRNGRRQDRRCDEPRRGVGHS